MDQDTERPSCLVKVDTQDFTNQLKLPMGVINFFNGVEIPNEIALRRMSNVKGRSWFVDLVKIEEEEEDGYVLCKAGWSDFVKDFALAFEDRILFEYNGKSQILFRVYDNNTGNPKDLVSRDMISTLPNQNNVNVERQAKEEPIIIVTDDDDDDDLSLDNQNEHGDNGLGDSEVELARRVFIKMVKEKWVPEVLQQIDTTHPSFVAVSQNSYTDRGFMNIPVGFADKLSMKTYELIRPSKAWKVEVVYYSRKGRKGGLWKLGRGWRQFAQENGLQEGDICVFQLVKVDVAEIQVFIFRVTDNKHMAI